jgi:putative inorganic carbon (HCO3(-)) transporter
VALNPVHTSTPARPVLQFGPAVAVGAAMGAIAAGAANSGSLTYDLAIVTTLAGSVAAMVGVRRLLLVALVLDIPLMWDINLFYRGPQAYPGGLNISLTTLALIGLYGSWASGRLLGLARASALRGRTALIPLGYVALAALSALAASDKLLALFGIWLLLQCLLVFLYVASTVRSREDVALIVGALIAGVAIESLAIIASYSAGHDFSFAGLAGHSYKDQLTGTVYRPGGTIGSPNVAGSFLGVVLPVIAMVFASSLGRAVKLLAGASFGLGAVALVLTDSRGGWLSFAVGMCVLVVLATRRELFAPSRLVLGLAVVAIVALAFNGLIAARLTGNDGGAAASRVPLMAIAWDMISAHPLTGVGINNFSGAMNGYVTAEFSGTWLAIVHNQYLLVWAESGIAALVAFLAFLASTIRRAWRASATGDRLVAPLAVGLTAGLVGMLPNMLVERFVNRPQTELLWLFAGLATAMACGIRGGPAPSEGALAARSPRH